MKQLKKQNLAYLLLALGFLMLIFNSGILGALPSFTWFVLLMLGAAFFWLWSKPKLLYWQRLLGFSLIAIVAIASGGRFSASAALGFPALGFVLTYLHDRRRWWAMIPAGLLASLAMLLSFNALLPKWDATPILFLGFAATFAWLYLTCAKRWAIIPTIVFILLTVLLNDPQGTMPGWILPVILIATGVFMLLWWRKENG